MTAKQAKPATAMATPAPAPSDHADPLADALFPKSDETALTYLQFRQPHGSAEYSKVAVQVYGVCRTLRGMTCREAYIEAVRTADWVFGWTSKIVEAIDAARTAAAEANEALPVGSGQPATIAITEDGTFRAGDAEAEAEAAAAADDDEPGPANYEMIGIGGFHFLHVAAGQPDPQMNLGPMACQLASQGYMTILEGRTMREDSQIGREADTVQIANDAWAGADKLMSLVCAGLNGKSQWAKEIGCLPAVGAGEVAVAAAEAAEAIEADEEWVEAQAAQGAGAGAGDESED